MLALIRAPKGLYGMIVNQTEIAKSKSDGPLIYRGYDIRNFTEHEIQRSGLSGTEDFLPKKHGMCIVRCAVEFDLGLRMVRFGCFECFEFLWRVGVEQGKERRVQFGEAFGGYE